MSARRTAVLLALTLVLAACGNQPTPPAPTAAEADAFIAGINEELRRKLPLFSAAAWLQSTYITSDSQMIAAKFNEEYLGLRARWVQEAKRFKDVQGLSPDTARALQLLKNVSAPPPSDPAKQAELAKILPTWKPITAAASGAARTRPATSAA